MLSDFLDFNLRNPSSKSNIIFLLFILYCLSPIFICSETLFDIIGNTTDPKKLIQYVNNLAISDINEAVLKGTDLDKSNELNETVLLLIAGHKFDIEILEELIKHGAQVNIKTKHGVTPLLLAARKSANNEILKVLIKAGAEIEMRDKKGRTPVMIASCDIENENLLKTLINSKAIINAYSNNGMTALMFAAYKNTNP